MKMELTRLVGGLLLGGVAMLVLLSACGGSPAETASAPATPQATATHQPTVASVPAAAATPVPTPTQSVVLPPTSTDRPRGGDLATKGKIIFEKTAGGVGCAYCHGLDGTGKGPAQVNAANIRGKNEGDIRTAIQGGVPMMGFIKLSDDEITAVAAYLQYLATQP